MYKTFKIRNMEKKSWDIDYISRCMYSLFKDDPVRKEKFTELARIALYSLKITAVR